MARKSDSGVNSVNRPFRVIAGDPTRVDRRPSPRDAASQKELVHARDLPCLVCGVRRSTLGQPAKNPCSARRLGVHDGIVEWALANAPDVRRLYDRIVEHMRARPREEHDDDIFTTDAIRGWFDRNPDHLWVLCDVHHRHATVGIPEIAARFGSLAT
jgi:hypothetical protein